MATALSSPKTVTPAKRSPRFMWLTAIFTVLAVAIGFGAGFLPSKLAQDDPTGLADQATVSLIEDNMAALNAGDTDALARTVTPDVVVTMMFSNGTVAAEFTGPDEIMAQFGSLGGLKAASEIVQQGDLVTMTYSEADTAGVQTFQVVNNRITHVWVIMN